MAGRAAGFNESIDGRPYDEAISLDDEDEEDEEVSTPGSSEANTPARGNLNTSLAQRGSPQKSPQSAASKPAAGPPGGGDEGSGSGSSSSSEHSDSESDSDEKSGEKKDKPELQGAYNPDDYKGLKVSAEIEELFQYIERYKPHTIELDAGLKPFIPELIPSVGEVDAFLKMPRPDGTPCGLGLTRLDEPTMNPSDPSILDLQLRSLSKMQDLEPMEVRSIENAEKNPKEIENWFRRINDLNRSKPAPTVQYSRRMPDIEQLMQVWPGEFEEFLQTNSFPDLADLNLDLPNYIRVLASILDVPVHSQMTETLHVIFTLYSEFKSNQHFSKAENTDNFGQPDPYSFAPIPFVQSFGAPVDGSMAPSRAPSPVRG
jgi:intraflagellar transport protein 46